jgi:hypothetical protein
MGRFASGVKGDAVTILAIWFGVAVIVGGLLGYAARRLKSAPKGLREGSHTSADGHGNQPELSPPAQTTGKSARNGQAGRGPKRSDVGRSSGVL